MKHDKNDDSNENPQGPQILIETTLPKGQPGLWIEVVPANSEDRDDEEDPGDL